MFSLCRMSGMFAEKGFLIKNAISEEGKRNRDMTFPPGCGTIKPKQLPFEMNGGAEYSIYYNMYEYI